MAAAGLSVRALAKKLAGSNDLRLIDNQRTNVKRWLDPDKGISEVSSARLGRVFGKPAGYFVRAPKPRPRQADRLEELATDVGTLLDQVGGIELRLTHLETELGRKPTRSKRQGGSPQ